MRGVVKLIIRGTVLGVLTTVGVAWACHLAARPRVAGIENYGRLRGASEGGGMLLVERVANSGKTWLKLLAVASTPRQQEDFEDTIATRMPFVERGLCAPWNGAGRAWPVDKNERAYVAASGWPFRALAHEYRYNPALDQPPTFLFFNQHPPAHTLDTPGGFKLPMFRRDFAAGVAVIKVPGSLPYAPIIAGMAGNTLVYGLAWAMLLVVPGAVQRRSRRRRGRCVRCGYDRRGVPVDSACPECGCVDAAVTPKAA